MTAHKLFVNSLAVAGWSHTLLLPSLSLGLQEVYFLRYANHYR